MPAKKIHSDHCHPRTPPPFLHIQRQFKPLHTGHCFFFRKRFGNPPCIWIVSRYFTETPAIAHRHFQIQRGRQRKQIIEMRLRYGIIGVDKDDIFALCRFNSRISRSSYPFVNLMDDAHPSPRCSIIFKNNSGIIGRTVIDEDDLKILKGLPIKSFEERGKPFFRLISRYYHTDRWIMVCMHIDFFSIETNTEQPCLGLEISAFFFPVATFLNDTLRITDGRFVFSILDLSPKAFSLPGLCRVIRTAHERSGFHILKAFLIGDFPELGKLFRVIILRHRPVLQCRLLILPDG